MCGKSSTTTSTSSPNPQAAAAYSALLPQAQSVSQLPFVPYSGEFTAPVNQQEQLAGANINQVAGLAQPFYTQAAQYATNAAQPITGQQINQYLSPYTQDVVKATEAQFNQQNAQQQSQLTGNAAAQDALGGDRVGLAQAQLAGQQQLAEAPVISGLYNQGYNSALQTALAEQQQQAQAAYSLGNIGTAAQNAALSGAGAQLGYGQLQQQTQQALDQAQYAQFLAQQGYPFQTAQWLAGITTGVGSQMGGTNVTQGPAPNPLSSILGLGAAGLGAYLKSKDGGRIERCGRAAPIAGFAMGGMPYSSLDDDAAAGYVPQIGLQIGNTMPKGGDGGSQQQPKNPIQSANQLLGLGKDVGSYFGKQSDVSIADAQQSGMLSGLSPEEVGFGEEGVFRHGGRIAGFAGGGSPDMDYADGAAPDDQPYQTASLTGSPDMPVISPDMLPGAPAPSLSGQTAGFVPPENVPTPPSDPRFGARPPAPKAKPSGSSWDHPAPANTYGFAPNLQTIETPGGSRATVSPSAAPHFKGFLTDLERAGAPITDIGGYNPRNIAGTHTPSQHAFGNAIDIDQQGRNLVSPEMQAWRQANPGVFSQLAAKWGLVSGENWRNPDFGHVEWRGDTGQRMAFAPEGDGAPEQQQSGFGHLFSHNPELGNALMAAGFGMMASRSPYLGNAIGEGGLAGLQAYQAGQTREQAQKKEAFNENLALKKLQQAADQAQARLKNETLRLQQGDERLELQRKAYEQSKVPPGYERTADGLRPITGGPADPDVAARIAAAKKNASVGMNLPAEAWDKNGDEFLSYLPADQRGLVKGLDDYSIDPKTLSVTGGRREALLNLVKQYDPDFDQKTYNQRYQARQRFTTGQQGNTVRSLNVAVEHLDTLGQLADALQNGDTRKLNQINNWIGTELGKPAVTNFNTAKQIVADEVLKSVIGSGAGSQYDREELQRQFAAAGSPAQLKGAIQTAERLMAGQVKGLRQQYEFSTGANDFDNMLTPATRERLQGLENQPTAAPGPAGGGTDPLADARAAIARGAPRDAVIKRLQEHGINPAGL